MNITNKIINLGSSATTTNNLRLAFLIIGASYSGKTHFIIEYILKHPNEKWIAYVEQIDQEWQRVQNIVKFRKHGSLIKMRSAIRSFKNHNVVIDDATVLNSRERNRIFSFLNILRKYNAKIFFLTHEFNRTEISPRKLDRFSVVAFMHNPVVDFPCLNVLLTGRPIMCHYSYPLDERLREIREREILLYDRQSQELVSTCNDDTKILEEALIQPINSQGIKIADYFKNTTIPTTTNRVTQKEYLKDLIKQGIKDHKELWSKLREEYPTASYGAYRVLFSDLKKEGTLS